MTRTVRARIRWSVATGVAAALMATMTPWSMSSAMARPPAKPGLVTNLDASATKAGQVYSVHSTWTAANNATAYKVTMTSTGGATFAQGRVTTTSFSGTTTMSAGSQVWVHVAPYNRTRRGRSATVNFFLPDLTAPVASYTITQESADGNVTLDVNSISDDLSAPADINQLIDWGDGTPQELHPGTETLFWHSYGPTQQVYYPTVTVSDLATNARTYHLTTVVDDKVVPTGSFGVGPSRAWARWTWVTVTQLALHDNLSAPDKIARSVDWGDGVTQPWTAGTTLRHRYRTAGSFIPAVTITDEAGNQATPTTSAVTVRVDATAPWLRFTLPRHHLRSVSRWTTLRGHSRDAGTGVGRVRLRAIERRNGVWYAYRPATHRWVRAGRTTLSAWNRSRLARVSVARLTHTWSVPLHRLRRGLLVYKASARDHVGNVSAWKTHRQRLTRP
jgi:hypothetical protein